MVHGSCFGLFFVKWCIILFTRSQRKQQKDLLMALQKVVVPIYCTSFLAVEEEKQQKITRVNTSLYCFTWTIVVFHSGTVYAPVNTCFNKGLNACFLWSQLLQLWEKNGYFDEETIQQLQNPALGIGQYQVRTCPIIKPFQWQQWLLFLLQFGSFLVFVREMLE